MTLDELVRHYPRAYHMADANSWDSIRQQGLLSTTALLDLFGVAGEERYRIESCHRPKAIEIRHPQYGVAIIRDQAPMRERILERCLVGINPRAWYELLNQKAFFWVSQARVEQLQGAKLYRNQENLIVTINMASLLDGHADRVTLSPINSGSTLYNPLSRGQHTFHSIDDYPFAERRNKRGLANAIAELAVDYSVPDLSSHILKVERRRGTEVLELIYSRAIT